MNTFGIPQPFVTGQLNTMYYSKQAPDYYKNAIVDAGGTWQQTRTARETLYTMQYIWETAKTPGSIPAELPADPLENQ